LTTSKTFISTSPRKGLSPNSANHSAAAAGATIGPEEKSPMLRRSTYSDPRFLRKTMAATRAAAAPTRQRPFQPAARFGPRMPVPA